MGATGSAGSGGAVVGGSWERGAAGSRGRLMTPAPSLRTAPRRAASATPVELGRGVSTRRPRLGGSVHSSVSRTTVCPQRGSRGGGETPALTGRLPSLEAIVSSVRAPLGPFPVWEEQDRRRWSLGTLPTDEHVSAAVRWLVRLNSAPVMFGQCTDSNARFSYQ